MRRRSANFRARIESAGGGGRSAAGWLLLLADGQRRSARSGYPRHARGGEMRGEIVSSSETVRLPSAESPNPSGQRSTASIRPYHPPDPSGTKALLLYTGTRSCGYYKFWLVGATVARLTPDQKAGGSNPSRVSAHFAALHGSAPILLASTPSRVSFFRTRPDPFTGQLFFALAPTQMGPGREG